MITRPIEIFNTLTWQEKIVLFFVSMLYFLQPFEWIDHRSAFFTLTVVGVLVFILHREILKKTGFWLYSTIIFLLVIPGILSIWGSYNISKTLDFVYVFPAAYFAGIAIYSLLSNYRARQILIGVIAVTSTLWAVDGIVQGICGVDILGNPLLGGKQVTGPFYKSTHMGILITVTLPVVLKWYSQFGLFFQVVYILLIGYVLVLTGVRTDWVTFLAAIFLFYFCVKDLRKFFLFKVIPVAAVACVLALSVSPLAREKAERFVNIPTTYEGWNNKLTNRVYIYSTALNMGYRNPVNGVGAKAFNDAYVEYKLEGDWISPERNGGAFHAHHPWLSIFAESGFVGVISLLLICWLLIFATIRSRWKLNFYHYPWLLSFVLILNPVNSMLPLFELWWFPVVLLVIIAHVVDVEYANRVQVLKQDTSLK
ncbi:O-antigen ligase family protein [PVC group bacterium]|nr:O-antigen ligase family protein [PVC group bacterium]